ncbi:MAG: hypothetical protein AAGG69_00535 [Pseudomonadota bacterium]
MASLKKAIEWIAENDETMQEDPEAMADLISVSLVADLFGKPNREIANKVISKRLQLGIIGSNS